MRDFKRSFAWLALLSFMLMVTPKSLLHDCEHQHADRTEKSGKHAGFSRGIDKCAVCDLQVPQLFSPQQQLSFHFGKIDLPEYAAAYEPASIAFSRLFRLRGPPATV
jgi:hypothetical protein